jgi:hypothetical protein
MDQPTPYRIVIRGVAGTRLLRPFEDEFTATTVDGDTVLVGLVTDAAHLHGLLVHLTSLNAEVVSVTTHSTRSTNP